MPSSQEAFRLDAFLKRSSKLLPCQKEMIKYWYDKGMSQRELAAMFKVSRRSVQFIIDPEKLKQNVAGRKPREPDKQKRVAAQTAYRNRKKQLLKNFNINETNNGIHTGGN